MAILGPHTEFMMLCLVFLNHHPLSFDISTNLENFRHNDYLAISAINLLSCVVAAFAQLGGWFEGRD